ncbi:MAG: Holliday junction resolvase RuvX [Bacteroidota bacterium]
MSRVIAIDYGLKRVGLAVTDPLRIIATPLTTVQRINTLTFLQHYVQREKVAAFVVGLPGQLHHRPSALKVAIKTFVDMLQQAFPEQHVFWQDERYTSRLALAGMVEGGAKKKDRRNKANLDKLSATLILQSFLTRCNHDQL